MMLAWAWKDGIRDALWHRLPQDSMFMILVGRIAFAFIATALLSIVVQKLGEKIEEQKQRGEKERRRIEAREMLFCVCCFPCFSMYWLLHPRSCLNFKRVDIDEELMRN